MMPIAAGALGLGPADPQQAHRRQLLHIDVRPDPADRHRGQPQRARQGEPDRPTAGGVHLQPPQPGRSDDRRARWSRTTSPRSARRSWRSDPIVGTMGKIMDAAFIDRDDPKKAVEGLKKVEELARKGLSILIAPEGTRLDTTEVGPFKKGPFRIAMSAGIPIVPIVIRNAEVIAARDSSTFNPGTVDVVVYPPIPVDDWTHDNLSERIAEVRRALSGHAQGLAARRGADARAVHRGRRLQRRRPRRRRPRKKTSGQEGRRQEDAPRRHRRRKRPPRKRRKRLPRRAGRESLPPTNSRRSPPPDDALVLASVSSPAEEELLNDWLERQRREHPDSKIDVLRLPGRGRSAAGRAGAARRGVGGRRGPVRRACAGVLGARRPADAVQDRGASVGPRHLPPAGTAAEAASCARTRRAPGWSPASPRRCPSCGSSGATRRSAENPQGVRAFRPPPRQPGDRTCRAAPAGPGVQVPAADQARDAGVGAVSRGPRTDSRRDRREGRGDARRTLHRMESVLGRPDSVNGPGDLQPGIRPEHRLRPHRGRVDAARVGKPSRGAAVLAPVLPRRRDRAGGDAGEPTYRRSTRSRASTCRSGSWGR